MRLQYRIGKGQIKLGNYGLALGNFDGLHLGHLQIIRTLKEESKKRGLDSCLYTFRRHPNYLLKKDPNLKLILSNDVKTSIIEKEGIDLLFFEEFTNEYARMSPREFIEKIVIGQFNAKLIVVGYDFSFGDKGKGRISDLEAFAKEYKFDLIVVPPISLGQEIVSSTLLRQYISQGQMEEYQRASGRPFSIRDQVVVAKQLGRQLGFPTLNLVPKEGFILPPKGVYASETLIGDKVYDGLTSIGSNPTFRGSNISIESFLFDFNKEIYGQEIEVFFYKKLRGEENFKTIDDFIDRLNMDVEEGKEYFNEENRKF